MQKKRIALSLMGGLMAEMCNKLFPLLILYFVVRRIGIERFGFAQFGFWLVDIGVVFVVFGYTNVGAIDIGRSRSEGNVNSVVSEVIVLRLIHAVLAFLILTSLVSLVPAYQIYFPVVMALGFLLFTTAIDLGFLHMGTQRMFSWSMLVTGAKLASLIAVVSLVEDADDAVLYAVLTVGANGLISLAALLWNWRRFKFEWPGFASLRRRFMTTLPFALTILLVMAVERFDLFVVEHYMGTTGAGLYGGPVRLVQSLMPVVVMIAAVFFSEIVATRGREILNKHIRLGCWVIWAILVPAAVGVHFVGLDVMALILGPGFEEMGPVLTILTFGLLAHSLVYIFGIQVLMVRRKMGAMNLALIIGLVAGLTICVALYPIMGLAGIAVAAMSGRLIAGSVMLVKARHFLEGLPWAEFLRSLVPAAAMGLVLYLVSTDSLVLNLALGAGVYGLLLMLFNRSKVVQLVALVRDRRGGAKIAAD